MKFKREWPIIYRDMYGSLLIVNAIYIIAFFIPFFREGYWDGFYIIIPLYFGSVCMVILGNYISGALTNTIIFDEIGITLLQRRKPPEQIRWEEVTRIIRTKYIGGKALVFWGTSWGYGDEMYFYTNEKIENYIISNHPELKDMFPDKKDFRKWQKWDKKLRW